MRIILIAIVISLTASFAHASKSSKTPYFASIRASKANIRTGPSVRYPIQWVYVKPQWPVEVTATFERWRKIKDKSGELGWIHESLLTGKRNVIVNANGVQEIYRLPIHTSSVVAIVENGVLAELVSCKSKWCKVQLEKEEGWIESKFLWGTKENENAN